MPTKEQIVFLLSGGEGNRDPALSLGGKPSHVPVFDGLNNLYDDINTEESRTGTMVDYRCFYLKNASNQRWKNVIAYIENYPEDDKEYVPPVQDGAFAQIGAMNADDKQQISVISQGVTGGSFTLDFDGEDVVVPWSHATTHWAQNFQNALRALDGLSEVTVTGRRVVTPVQRFHIFTVLFEGADGNRNHPPLQVKTNALIGPSAITISETKLVNGGPANATAQEIPVETLAPSNVTFKYATSADPVELGTLNANEYVAIWVKRFLLEPYTEDYFEDKFTIYIQGKAEM